MYQSIRMYYVCQIESREQQDLFAYNKEGKILLRWLNLGYFWDYLSQ